MLSTPAKLIACSKQVIPYSICMILFTSIMSFFSNILKISLEQSLLCPRGLF